MRAMVVIVRVGNGGVGGEAYKNLYSDIQLQSQFLEVAPTRYKTT